MNGYDLTFSFDLEFEYEGNNIGWRQCNGDYSNVLSQTPFQNAIA